MLDVINRPKCCSISEKKFEALSLCGLALKGYFFCKCLASNGYMVIKTNHFNYNEFSVLCPWLFLHDAILWFFSWAISFPMWKAVSRNTYFSGWNLLSCNIFCFFTIMCRKRWNEIYLMPLFSLSSLFSTLFHYLATSRHYFRCFIHYYFLLFATIFKTPWSQPNFDLLFEGVNY